MRVYLNQLQLKSLSRVPNNSSFSALCQENYIYGYIYTDKATGAEPELKETSSCSTVLWKNISRKAKEKY